MADEVVPGRVILEETASLERLGVGFRLGLALGRDMSLAELDFDAVYLGLGTEFSGLEGLELDGRGRVAIDPVTFATGSRGVFAGGSMGGGLSIIGSVSDGRRARHENRARLKTNLLKEIWGEEMAEPTAFENIRLIIAEELGGVLEKRLILAEDVQKVIEYAERTGTKCVNQNTGHFLAYFKPVSVTYWAALAVIKVREILFALTT